MAVNQMNHEEFDCIIAYQPGAVNKCTLRGTIGTHYVPISCLGSLDPYGGRKFTFIKRPEDQLTSVVAWPFEDWEIENFQDYLEIRFVDELVLVEEPNKRVFEDLKEDMSMFFVPEKYKKRPKLVTGRVYERWNMRLAHWRYRMLVDKETRQMYFEEPMKELMIGLILRAEYQIEYNMELINKTIN